MEAELTVETVAYGDGSELFLPIPRDFLLRLGVKPGDRIHIQVRK